MLTKTEAIVLHSFKYGETRMIVDMFTRVFGRLSFIVPLPKTPRGRMKKQFFQPLTLLNIEADVRPRLQLQKLSSASIWMPLVSLQTHPAKLSMTLFLAEFLYHALKGEQQNEPLFDYVVTSLQWLDSAEGHVANFHLVFLMRLARFLGFYPNLDDYTPGCYFDLRASAFCPLPPVHHDLLLPAEAEKVQLMMRMDYQTMHLFQMSHYDRGRLLDIALSYYRIHLPAFPELRSLRVLQDMWG
ncbi:MAG: DNA repair protein RecO [Prevotella sp.]|nr:DNA repair protein RecO [Prevotella sp.]MBQ8486634.1 DNA repair protein RecO [Prevotella sp.]